MLIQKKCKGGMTSLFRKKKFLLGDWILLYDSRFKYFKVKFHTCWMGPYEVVWVFENGVVEIKTIDGQSLVFLVNRHRLKKYF